MNCLNPRLPALIAVAFVAGLQPAFGGDQPAPAQSNLNSVSARLEIEFDTDSLQRSGLTLQLEGAAAERNAIISASYEITESIPLHRNVRGGRETSIESKEFHAMGVAFLSQGSKTLAVGNWAGRRVDAGEWMLTSTVRNLNHEHPVAHWRISESHCSDDECVFDGSFSLTISEVAPTESRQTLTGSMRLVVHLVDAPTVAKRESRAGCSTGPDIVVCFLPGPSVRWYAHDEALGISAFAFGTTACNKGDVSANWRQNPIPEEPDISHPVIAQNAFRLRDHQFEQIGMAWVKHGFFSSSGDTDYCGDCLREANPDPALLYPGCLDTYSRSLNGNTAFLGPRQDVNPVTGAFPFPYSAPAIESSLDRRVQIRDEDLDPDLNAGAVYIYEGMYIAYDDAAAGNDDNNASYREFLVTESAPDSNIFTLTLTGAETTETPAIYAWAEHEPDVQVSIIDVPNDGRFYLGSKAWRNDVTGLWHYEYALQNYNSHRAARSFNVGFPAGVTVSNVGFHDVDEHSGAPCDANGNACQTTDWPTTLQADSVTWATDTFATNEVANALRWGSLYNFRFTADSCPQQDSVTIGLFRPPAGGDPVEVSAAALVPGGPIEITGAFPPDLSIDARQPSAPDETTTTGLDRVDIVVNRCADELVAADFQIVPDVGVSGVSATSSTDLQLQLDAHIEIGTWSTITHAASQTQTMIGYLPGDVDESGVSTADDVTTLVADLDNQTLPVYSSDIDRSDSPTAADILREIDLLNGADEYDAYLDVALP